MAFGELDERSGFGSSNDNNGMIDLLSPSMHQKENSLKQTKSNPALIQRGKSMNLAFTLTGMQSFSRHEDLGKNGSVNIKVRFERENGVSSPQPKNLGSVHGSIKSASPSRHS